MKLDHERRLDNAVYGGNLGRGEIVEVKTKMGSEVFKGSVETVTPAGVIIRESNGGDKFFPMDLYLFVPVEPVAKERVSNTLECMSLDDRVQAKLNSMGEAGDPSPEVTGAKKMIPDSEDDEDDDADEKDDDKDDKKKKKKDPDGSDSEVDVDDLPNDIKGAISSASGMDETKLNAVLGGISDAAMKGLKRSNVDETEIFDIVHKIQDAVHKILSDYKKDE